VVNIYKKVTLKSQLASDVEPGFAGWLRESLLTQLQ